MRGSQQDILDLIDEEVRRACAFDTNILVGDHQASAGRRTRDVHGPNSRDRRCAQAPSAKVSGRARILHNIGARALIACEHSTDNRKGHRHRSAVTCLLIWTNTHKPGFRFACPGWLLYGAKAHSAQRRSPQALTCDSWSGISQSRSTLAPFLPPRSCGRAILPAPVAPRSSAACRRTAAG